MRGADPRVATTRLAITALALAGAALALAVFWPGVVTFDARYVYDAIRQPRLGDWQSPVMSVLWAAIDPVAPGSRAMLILLVALYWTSFATLGLALARVAPWRGIAVVALGFVPPAFMMSGIIWRDMLFGGVWLFAAVIAHASSDRAGAPALVFRASSLALVALGVLLRPNAALAAPILITYVMWPSGVSIKRLALAYVPAVVAMIGLVQVIYYGVLNAERQNPLHSLAVFDLGGISHAAGVNVFPVTWTPQEEQQLFGSCYDPVFWDVYWYGRCAFVMRRLEQQERIFGTPALTRAWRDAILAHPLAYARHRATFAWRMLAGRNLTIWRRSLDDPDVPALPGRAFAAMVAVHDALVPTGLFRTGVWLLACVGVAVLGWRRRDTADGAFAFAVAGAGIVYVATYVVVGVASDFRYGWFSVLAALTGGAVIVARRDRGAT